MTDSDHVLVAQNSASSSSGLTYHDPGDDPDRPGCPAGGREDVNWVRKDSDAALPQYSYCKHCSGEADRPDSTGTDLADKIRRLAAEREGGIDV